MEDMMHIAKAAAYIGAAIAISVGTFGPAISQGLIGARACENLGKYPESASNLRTLMMIALGFVETSSIYALLIAAALLYLGSLI